jgi:hypothetical protein
MAERHPDVIAGALVKVKRIRSSRGKERRAVEYRWLTTKRIEAHIDPRVRERMEEDA